MSTPASTPIGDPELTGHVSLTELVSAGDDLPERPVDDVVAHTIRDNEGWWSDIYPELYGAVYTPIEGGFFPGYVGRGDPIPGCPGPEPMTLDEIQSFLALYCHTGDFFAYDDTADGPLAGLIDTYGTVVVAVILSHEWAHAIQTRAGVDLDELPTILSEQQADCFAGAWAQRSLLGDSAWIRLDDGDIDSIVRFYGQVADPASDDPQAANGHGSLLDRLGAFAAGFDSGPTRCVDLIDQPLPLVSDVVPLGAPTPGSSTVADDLNAYWGGAPVELASSDDSATIRCPGRLALPGDIDVCPAERAVVYHPDGTLPSDPVSFDGAVLIANAWALLGPTPSADPGSQTAATDQVRRWCAVGTWVRESAATTSDVDAGVRSIIAVTEDIPLLIVANEYRRGLVTGAC